MRSEKEIKEKLLELPTIITSGAMEDIKMDGEEGALKWVLEGEPCYSVEELKKLAMPYDSEHKEKPSFYFSRLEREIINYFLDMVKSNPEKVKEILERD